MALTIPRPARAHTTKRKWVPPGSPALGVLKIRAYVDSEIAALSKSGRAELQRQDHRVTILLAEDEPSLRQMLGVILESAGYDVMIAEDGHQALRLASVHAGKIDILVSDIQMPGLTGPDLAKELKRSRPHLKIMFMSGCVSAIGVDELEWRFLQKPFAPDRLLEEIRIALRWGP